MDHHLTGPAALPERAETTRRVERSEATAALVDRAHAALTMRDTDPDGALALADLVVLASRSPRHIAARAVAHRTAALVYVDRGQIGPAHRRAGRAVVAARRAGDSSVLAGCLTTAAAVGFLRGAGEAMFDLLDEAAIAAREAADVDAEVQALAQRAWMLQRCGRWRDALGTIDGLLNGTSEALPMATGERRTWLLSDRANVLAELCRFDEAVPAFDAAVATARAQLERPDLIEVMRNRATCLTYAGRIPEAMAAFDEIDSMLDESSAHQRLLQLVARSSLLLDARLIDEAVAVTAEATAIGGRGAPADLRAEAHLLRARALDIAGESGAATAAAKVAERLYSQLGVPGRSAVAARIAARGAANGRRLEALEAAAIRLGRAGLRIEALGARLDALRAAIGRNDRAGAARQRRATRPGRTAGPALARAQAWLAEALWLEFVGRDIDAGRAVEAGLDVLDEHRASLGGTELRAHASGLGSELAAVGLGLCLARRDGAGVLRMSERWRAGIVLRRPTSGSGEMAELLAELRGVQARSDSPTESIDDLDSLHRRRADLEDRLRHAARRTPGAHTTTPRPRSVADLRRVLGEATLLEIVGHQGRYHAVVIPGAESGRRRTVELVDLCPDHTPVDETRDLLFALRRLARTGLSAPAAAAAKLGAEEALAALDRALVVPVADLLGTGPIVVVPPAPLHAIPWPSLPSLTGSRVSVAPSSTWWASTSRASMSRASTSGASTSRAWTSSSTRGASTRGVPGRTAPGAPSGSVVLASGPRLPGASDELRALGALYPDSVTLAGDAATGERLVEALDGAGLAHIACHSRPRADHPHLSALEVADGPFTVYDFERLANAPRRVVLSACESGISAVRPGEELLGFLSALMSLGTSEILASVVPVPDLATTPFMVAFHRHLSSDGGLGFDEALRRARLQTLAESDEPADFVVATAFVAFCSARSPK